MLVAAAVCPHPPLLVPAVAAGAAGELDACRAACREAIRALVAAGPDLLALVGPGELTRRHDPEATGSLARYGLDLALGQPGRQPASLPLSLGIGRWLLDGAFTGPRLLQEVAAGEPPRACAALGAQLAAAAPRVGMLVLADGSAYPLQTPVGDDGRGGRYDEAVVDALTRADPGGLLALDPADDEPLWVGGRPALQALAGALAGAAGAMSGRLLWRGAPYGVGYFVAQLAGDPP